MDEKENDREKETRIAATYLPVRYIKNATSFNAGVSHGENLAAIRHRYPRIRDYVFAPYANTIATRERINNDPVLASFAANDSLSSLDAVPHRKTSPSTHAHPYFDFLPGND